MTDLISRPPRQPRPPGARRTTSPRTAPADTPQSVSWAGVLAALRAAALGLLTVMVLVLVAWATAADSGASATEAVGGGLAIWLVGHLTRLSVPGGGYGLAPLGLTLLLAALLFSSGVRAARAAQVRDRRAVGSLTLTLAASYAAVAVVVALLARTPVVQPQPVTAFLGAGGLALVAGGAGVVRGSGRSAAWWSRVPTVGRLAVTGALGAVTVLLAGGSLLVAAMLSLHRGEASGVVSGLRAGISGSLLVLLICALYAPTAVVWGASYLVGPGFAAGTGTSVAVAGVHLGAVPALPLLAALPANGAGGVGWPLAVAATLAAGLVSGVLVDRAAAREPAQPISSWRDLLRVAGLTGAVTGLALGALAAASSGPAGPGRLAHAGPTAWWVALAAAATTALVVAGILAGRRRELFHRAAR
jgi:Family of unknown function (DUF6350)